MLFAVAADVLVVVVVVVNIFSSAATKRFLRVQYLYGVQVLIFGKNPEENSQNTTKLKVGQKAKFSS
jgi:hypothetical protein